MQRKRISTCEHLITTATSFRLNEKQQLTAPLTKIGKGKRRVHTSLNRRIAILQLCQKDDVRESSNFFYIPLRSHMQPRRLAGSAAHQSHMQPRRLAGSAPTYAALPTHATSPPGRLCTNLCSTSDACRQRIASHSLPPADRFSSTLNMPTQTFISSSPHIVRRKHDLKQK